MGKTAAISTSTSLHKGRLPIVIGAIGHHDLFPEDHAAYRDRLERFFNDLRQSYPSTPIRVISSLAVGADRLIAEIALQHGYELIVPLPLHEAEYLKDFPDNIEEFRQLRDAVPAENVFALPLAEGSTDENVREHGAARDNQYAQAGAYVALHCHILVALWDGTFKQAMGGTSHAIQLKLSGTPLFQCLDESSSILDSVDSGPVFHIEARRHKQKNQQGDLAITPGAARWVYPPGRNESDYRRIYDHIESFNADPARLRCAGMNRPREELVPVAVKLESGEQQVLDLYSIADALAIHYRRIAHRTLTAILFLAAGMALAFEVYAHFIGTRIVLALYPAFFASICGLYFWHRKIGAHERHLDYRALAEGLRVQFCWRLAGICQNVSSSYLRKQNDELQWIREGLRAANALPAPHALPDVWGLRHWISSQETYFIHSAHQQERRICKLERYSNWLYGAGLLTSVIVVAFWGFLEHLRALHHALIVFMGFSPVVAALWMKYAESTGLQTQCKQYVRFATIFQRARKHLERLESQAPESGNEQQIIRLIRELGKEALIENGDWVLLHRERPIEIPKG